ncbi:MAG TPA: CoA pyrophosphatase [Rhizomicrobium sp.]
MNAAIIARIASGEAGALHEFLLPAPPALALRGDFDPLDWPDGKPLLAEAAVLMPIITRAEPSMLFTRRCAHLSRHAGQVSFPGGRAEPQDASLVETALRETQEEIGLDPSFVTIAGFLERHETGTGYAIQPVVGLVAEGFTLTPDPREVDAIFEVPLAFLLNPANAQEHRGEFEGRLRRYHSFVYGEHRVWGATAAMLMNFRERLGMIETPP